MEPTLDEVWEELEQIHDELLGLASDVFARRSELRERQSGLGQKSRELIEGEPLHSAALLRAEVKRLQEVRDRLPESRLAHSSTSVGDAGIDAVFTAAIDKPSSPASASVMSRLGSRGSCDSSKALTDR